MRAAALVSAAVVLLAAGAPAQREPPLDAALRLAAEGRGDSARLLVRRVLESASPADSIYARALFVSGLVASDTDQAMRALQRVVVEFGLSPWADGALLRLIQLTHATGDPSATVTWLERFRRDHAGSEHLASAAYWGARAYFDLQQERQGCATLREGLAAAGGDVEVRNRLRFYARRCQATDDEAPANAGTPTASFFTVQVLAAKSVAAADQMLRALREAGFDATVARDTDGLLKVRVGRFARREEANRMATRLRQRLRIEAFVTEVTP